GGADRVRAGGEARAVPGLAGADLGDRQLDRAGAGDPGGGVGGGAGDRGAGGPAGGVVVAVVGREADRDGGIDGVVLEGVGRARTGVAGPVGRAGGDGVAAVQVEVAVREGVGPAARAVVAGGADRVRAGGEARAVPGLAGADLGDRQLDRAGAGDPGGGVGGGAGDRGAGGPAGGVVVAVVGREADRDGGIDGVVLEGVGRARTGVAGPVGRAGGDGVAAVQVEVAVREGVGPAARAVVAGGADRVRAGGEARAVPGLAGADLGDRQLDRAGAGDPGGGVGGGAGDRGAGGPAGGVVVAVVGREADRDGGIDGVVLEGVGRARTGVAGPVGRAGGDGVAAVQVEVAVREGVGPAARAVVAGGADRVRAGGEARAVPGLAGADLGDRQLDRAGAGDPGGGVGGGAGDRGAGGPAGGVVVAVVGREADRDGGIDGVVLEGVGRARTGVAGPVGRAGGDGVAAVQVEVAVREGVGPAARAVVAGGADRVRAGGEARAVPGLAGADLGDRQLDRAGAGDPGGGVGGGAGDRGAGGPAGGVVVAVVGREADRDGGIDGVVLEGVGRARTGVAGPVGRAGGDGVAAVQVEVAVREGVGPAARAVVAGGADRVRAGGEARAVPGLAGADLGDRQLDRAGAGDPGGGVGGGAGDRGAGGPAGGVVVAVVGREADRDGGIDGVVLEGVGRARTGVAGPVGRAGGDGVAAVQVEVAVREGVGPAARAVVAGGADRVRAGGEARAVPGLAGADLGDRQLDRAGAGDPGGGVGGGAGDRGAGGPAGGVVVAVVGREADRDGGIDGVVLEGVGRARTGVAGPVGRAGGDGVAAVQVEVAVREGVGPAARAVVAGGADRVRAGGEARAVPGLAGADLGDRQLDRAGAGDPGGGVGGGAGDRGAGGPAGGVVVAVVGREADRDGGIDGVVLEGVGRARTGVAGPVGRAGGDGVAAVQVEVAVREGVGPAARAVVAGGADRVRAGGEARAVPGLAGADLGDRQLDRAGAGDPGGGVGGGAGDRGAGGPAGGVVVAVVGREADRDGGIDGVVLEGVGRARTGVAGPVGRAGGDGVAAVQVEVAVREGVGPAARAVVAGGADRVRAGGEARAVPGLAGADLGDRQLDRAGAGDPGGGVGGGAGDRGAGGPAGGVVVAVVGREADRDGGIDGVVLEGVGRARTGVAGPVGRAGGDGVAAVQVEVAVREGVGPAARAVVAGGADRVRAGGEARAVPGLAGADLGDRQLDRAGAGDPGGGVGGGAGDRGAGGPAGGVVVAVVGREADRDGGIDGVVLEGVGRARTGVAGPVGRAGGDGVAAVQVEVAVREGVGPAARAV